MPGFNGMGPNGMGPMTGGGRGYCAIPIERARRPFGRGRGWRNRYYLTDLPVPVRTGTGFPMRDYPNASEITSKQEIDMLKDQASVLQDEVSYINERIKELESIKNKNE